MLANASEVRDEVCLGFLHHVLFMRELISTSFHSILGDEGEQVSGDRKARRRFKFKEQLRDLVEDMGLFESLIEGEELHNGSPWISFIVSSA